MPAPARATAARDPRVARAARLLRDAAFRREQRAFAVDGDDLLAEALAAGVHVEMVFESALREPRWQGRLPAGTEHVAAAPDALRALAAVGHAPRVVAVCRMPVVPAGPLPPCSLVLVRVTGEGNIGTIARTAAALRLPRVELTAGCGDPWSRRALRASLGASLRPGLVAASERTPGDLAAQPGRPPLAAAVPRGGVPPDRLPPEAAVVIGSERDGLTAAEAATCDLAVTVPAAGFESLNVAAAAAILAWELVRPRAPGAGGGDG